MARVVRTTVLVAAGLMVVAVGVIAVGAARRRAVEEERFADREAVVRLVRSGALRAGPRGNLTLPRRWSRTTANGHVYVLSDGCGGHPIFFPESIERYVVDWGPGRPDETRLYVSGYVFSDVPLPKNQWFVVPIPHSDEANIWAEPPVRPHWYWVEPFRS